MDMIISLCNNGLKNQIYYEYLDDYVLMSKFVVNMQLLSDLIVLKRLWKNRRGFLKTGKLRDLSFWQLLFQNSNNSYQGP